MPMCETVSTVLWKGSIAAMVLLLAGCAAEGPQQRLDAEPVAETPQASRAQIHTELGAGYYSRGQFGVALQELNDAVKADPSYAPAYNVLGLVYMELREDSLATQSFEKALSLRPNDSETHNNYGWFLCQRNKVDAALAHFLAAIKNPLYSSPERSYVNAGICVLKKNDLAAAEDYFSKALKLRPQDAQALYYLADINFRNGKYIEAKSYFVRLTQVQAATAESLWLGLRIERKLGNRNAESSYGLQLRNQYPNSPQTQALLSGRYE
jgi:type IV pilus assembly protein PilF